MFNDRVASKKTVKTLKDIGNAPGTTIRCQYWFELFKQYATVTLGIENRAKLLDDGQITKDPVREKQWLTCQIVKKLATAIFSDAVQQGTVNWDTILAGTFSLVVQAAMASRSSDFMRSAHYTGDEYLKWQDMELVATASDDDNMLVFKMMVKLLYRKGHKRDKAAAFSIELGQLVDNNHSVVDPVKLCIAYALRVGAVKETSWSDLLNVVRSRPSKRMLWTKPSSPVFYALTCSQKLDMFRPAPVDQQRRFLCLAAELVGMLNVPVAHDLSDSYSGDNNKVRRSLGHSMAAMGQGQTDAYIGRNKGDSWATRLDQASKDIKAALFGVQMAAIPFKKRKVTTADIDKYCDTRKLAKTERKNRDISRRALAKVQHERWVEYQKSEVVTTSLGRAPLQDVTNISQTTSGFGAQTHTFMKQRDASNDNENDNDEIDNENDEINNVNTGTIFVLENIDPALRVFAGDMLGVQINPPAGNVGSSLKGASGVESMAAGCISLWAASRSRASNEPAVLTAPLDQFIRYLSTVNLVSLSDTSLESRASGNSRDAPSRFLYYCQTEHCARTFYTALRCDQHQVNCHAEPTLPGPLTLDNVHPMSEAAVSSPAPTTAKPKRKRKAADINKASEGFPKPCPDSDICGVTKDFATDNLLQNNRILHHDPNWPKEPPCNVPDCQLPKDRYFLSREAFRRHLNSYHLLNGDQAREHIVKILPVPYRAPRGISKNYLSTMCLYPDCKTQAEFTAYTDCTMHLKRTHSLTVDQYPRYVPTLAASDAVALDIKKLRLGYGS
ncbi:MAG: hypothetical protein Q9220_001333 [cf. Caloplaca sp. 1 TL-2023]